ncbi:MAG: hypothetical protein P8Y18_04590, partial [Candidatus Bathyarchaeota archaeon]
PTNTTYNNNSVLLKIKISTKFDGYYLKSSEKRISYSLDGTENLPLEITNYSYSNDTKTSTVEASTELSDLTQGVHNLTVFVEYDYDVHIIDSQSSVSFSIDSPNSFPLISMPEEYINYTITKSNGQFWAKVYGKYPIDIVNSSSQLQFPMVYPTPPNTSNIHITLNDRELSWTNYTQIYPQELHYTAIGNWSMIQCILENVSESFLLEIQYEHPIQQIDGEYVFLYDININPYLSSWSNMSSANFYVRFQTDITELQINTITTNGEINPVNFEVTQESQTQGVSFQVVSEYFKPVPGDLIVSFKEDIEIEPVNSVFWGSSFFAENGFALLVVILIIALALLLFLKFRKRDEINE